MSEMPRVINYAELLKEIDGKNNSLLVANGFNSSLGVNTSYMNIFKVMVEKYDSLYGEHTELMEKVYYDLEKYIEILCEKTEDEFLKKLISNKVKLDFMKAAHCIAKSNIKKVYSENNKGVYILLEKFDKYFTLNYDPFLYLFLLKFKSVEDDTVYMATPTLLREIENFNSENTDIYNITKSLRNKGEIDIRLDGKDTIINLKHSTKSDLAQYISAYGKNNNYNWDPKEIKKAVELVLEEEKENNIIKGIDDGFRNLKQGNLFQISNTYQNLFFLHGAFHIYEDDKTVKKITEKNNQSLYNRLEEILNDESKNIITVFRPDKKIKEIQKSEYLAKCFSKLSELEGNVVIIGASLDENDSHIFKQIDDSNVTKIYISFFGENNLSQMVEKSIKYFKDKEIIMLDASTISYEK